GDAVVKTIPVMTADESERLVGQTASPELQKRIADANRALGELHAAHDLVALDALAVDNSAAPEDRRLAKGKGLAIDWVPSTLVVKRDGAPVLTTHTPDSWLTK